jgi:hypothetical protein
MWLETKFLFQTSDDVQVKTDVKEIRSRLDDAATEDVAIVAVLTCLLALGYVKGKVVGVSPGKSALEVFIIGTVATAIGIIAGKIFEV